MPPQSQSDTERVRLKGPGGKFFTIPSHQSGAFLRQHPDYDVAPSAASGTGQGGGDDQGPRGALANFWDDIKGFRPGGVAPYPGVDVDNKSAMASASHDRDQARKAAGYSLPYRALAPAAESLGTNVSGMEESAKQGDEGGVLGHAAVPLAFMSPELLKGAKAGAGAGVRGAFRGAEALREGMTLDPTKPGSIIGAKTRGTALLDRVDAAAQDIPVDHTAAYQWAKKAEALGKHGFNVPKPVTDFIQMIESGQKSSVHPTGEPGAGIDAGAQINPLNYQAARNFEQSLGAKIPWEADPSGKMNGLMKKMREAIGQDTAAALKPHGLDVPYLRGKAEFEKVYNSGKVAKVVGKYGGKVLGYTAGGAVGHPLILGGVGGAVGEGAAGSMMKSVVDAGSRTPKSAPSLAPEAMSPEAAIKQWRANMPPKSAAKPGMNPMETKAWQQSLFNEKPTPDYGAQAKPKVDVEAARLKRTAQPARDTDIIGKVRLDHPDWSLSKQLMEAAKRAQETGQ